MPTNSNPRTTSKPRRTAPLAFWVAVADVMHALGCGRSTAYDQLRRAAGRRPGERGLLRCRPRSGNDTQPSILVAVLRSGEGDTTKGGHADLLPVPDALVPYLSSAIDASPSEFVFPREDGAMLPLDVAVDKILRRTLGRVGIVDGYDHACRRLGADTEGDGRRLKRAAARAAT
ncbi:MAG: hypothetical protein LC118_08585 [Dehalococcoidia bacterium]|nr:hypothetical protein [Dehalococcoidia bacterium]